MDPSPTLIRGTLRALLHPKRVGLICVVAIPLLLAQHSYSRDRFAVPIGILMILVFVTAAPVSYRVLFPEPVSLHHTLLRFMLFGTIGSGAVLTVGAVLPKMMGLGVTFLTRRPSLVVCAALFIAGGWGLGRDIGLEASLLWERKRAELYRREAELAQLLALRTHLDPHFLFNTLNAIAEWCREDGVIAERAVIQLSAMLRDILTAVRRSSWPLESELELIRTLFTLHLLRDPALFTFEVDVPRELLATAVPPLLLLPLAENAVKHGPARGHRGRIVLRAREQDGALLFALENPGLFRGPRLGSSGVPTVERRLELAYAGRAELQVRTAPDDETRTRAALRLPIEGPLAGVLT